MPKPRFKGLATQVILLQTNETGEVTVITLYRESRRLKRRRDLRAVCGGDCGCDNWAWKMCTAPLLAAAEVPKMMASVINSACRGF
jgi:hypothetical protein